MPNLSPTDRETRSPIESTGDPLADAILALADQLRAATGRIVDAYLAARWPEAATAYCPTCRPDTTQVLVCELDLGDTVLTADGTRLTVADTDPGADTTIVDFEDGQSHVWVSDETVPVILVDCPACDGLTGTTGRCPTCAGLGRVRGSVSWGYRGSRALRAIETAGRLSMEEADIVAGGVA